MITGRKIDSIIMDDLEDIELRINQSRVKKHDGKLMNSAAPFSERWADAENKGYKVYRGKKRWRLEHTSKDKYIVKANRVDDIKQLGITTILKQENLQKNMTMGAIKRAALPYVLAHEVVLRVKHEPERPILNPDEIHKQAKENLSAWFAKTLDDAAFKHFVQGDSVSVRCAEDGTPEVKFIPLHDIYRGGEDASVDGAAPSGQAANGRT